MEIRTEKRVIEVEDKIYIAEDGKEFGTQADCMKYEEELQDEKNNAEAEKLELKEFERMYPLDCDGQYINDNHNFTWYKVNNEEEFETVKKVYGSDDWGCIEAYPEIICVEYENYWGKDAWSHLLSDMRNATVYFWKRHGFDVEFKEITK